LDDLDNIKTLYDYAYRQGKLEYFRG
jgi:hypothetical protein